MFHLVVAVALAATATSTFKTAVFDLQAAGVPEELAKSAGLVLPTEVRRHAHGAVITGDDIKALLGLERQKELLGCKESSCMAEIGGALGVDEMVNGSLGKLGQTYVLELRRVDTHKARTVASATRTVKSADDLVEAVRSAVDDLYAPRSPATPAAVAATAPKSKGLPGTPFVIAGGVLAAAAVAGLVWSHGVYGKVQDQQAPGAAPEVPRSQASTASTVWTLSLVAAGVGAAGVAFGVYRWLDTPAQVAVAPLDHGAALALGGRF